MLRPANRLQWALLTAVTVDPHVSPVCMRYETKHSVNTLS